MSRASEWVITKHHRLRNTFIISALTADELVAVEVETANSPTVTSQGECGPGGAIMPGTPHFDGLITAPTHYPTLVKLHTRYALGQRK